METLPEIMIIFDAELPGRSFYIRNASGTGVEMIDLPVATLPAARKAAREKGFEPTHWMRVGESCPNRF